MGREKTILLMREKGRTYQYIADIFGISRQRVHQIITGYKSEARKKFGSVREQNNNQCQICWRIKSFRKSGVMDVHHLDGNHKNNNPDNLLVVCEQCHSHIHHNS